MVIRNKRSAKKPDLQLECFLSCAGLGSTDIHRKDGLSPFAVLYMKQNECDDFSEIFRTETRPNTTSPAFCLSSEIRCRAEDISTTYLRVEIYHRVREGEESLEINELFGVAIFPLKSVRDAEGMQFLSSLSHPTKERERVGIVQIKAEHLCLSATANELVEIDLMAAGLRRREWSQASKIVPQSYEILRAHAYDDADGQVVWLPIYRSDRVSTYAKKTEHVDFSRATMTNRHLCNGDEERRIRIVLLAGNPDKKTGGRANDMGFIDITLRDLCEVDPTEEVFEIENAPETEESEVGSMSLLTGQPTDVGSHFVLQVNHASCFKYVSLSSPESKIRSSVGQQLKKRRNGLKKGISKKLDVVQALDVRSLRLEEYSSAPMSNVPTANCDLGDYYDGVSMHGPISGISLFSEDSQGKQSILFSTQGRKLPPPASPAFCSPAYPLAGVNWESGPEAPENSLSGSRSSSSGAIGR